MRALGEKHSGPSFRHARELTDLPPGTEQGSDNVTERHTFGDDFGGPVPAFRGRGPSRRGSPRRLHWCTDAGNTPRNRHFVPLFRPSGAAPMLHGPLGKALQHHEIGHDLYSARPSQNRVARVHQERHINVR